MFHSSNLKTKRRTESCARYFKIFFHKNPGILNNYINWALFFTRDKSTNIYAFKQFATFNKMSSKILRLPASSIVPTCLSM